MFFSVLEPNGALRTVSYIADERGFNPIVSYSYGHPQSAVSVTSATGPASIVKQAGVYAPAYVADNRVQIVDKSNIYAAPPPALNFQAFALPGPSAPVVVPAPLRQVAPVVKASAAIAANYAPAFVPAPNAYLPPPPPQVVAVPQPQAVLVKQQPAFVTKVVQPAKFLTVPPLKAVKVAAPAVTVVKDSYSEAPRNTFRDPNAPSYPDAVKVTEPVADYGPPNYVPPPPITEAPVQVVKQVAVKAPVQVVAAPQPVVQVQQYIPQPVVQKVVAAPPPLVQVQKVSPQIVNPGLYAAAIGYHTHTTNPDSYIHSYGTQGYQVTSSRKFNKGFLPVAQKVVQPAPVYGPPAVAVAQQVVQPAPVYGPPAYAVQQKFVQPAPVYGPPPQAFRVVAPRPVYGPPQVQKVAVAPPPLVQSFVSAPVALPPPPAPVAVAAPVAQVAPAPVVAPVAIAPGKKQNPLTFAYSYDQGGAKVTHSYSGSGW